MVRAGEAAGRRAGAGPGGGDRRVPDRGGPLHQGATDKLRPVGRRSKIFQRTEAFYGVELVQDTHRLALMNLMLHGIEGELRLGDSMSPTGSSFPKADVILTNPPFGTKKGGGLPTRDDFTVPTSNKQLAFLQHVYRGLKPGGRAAVVLPDNVLFEENTGRGDPRDLMDKCDLHTILRLPTGIFYAQGVKTNVLFFTGREGHGEHQGRVGVRHAGEHALVREADAVHAGALRRVREGVRERPATGRASGRTRAKRGASGGSRGRRSGSAGTTWISAWLKDENATSAEDLPEPEEIAAEIVERLRVALEEMEGLRVELGGA
jgi:type I restriction enzyme M protein